MSSLCSSKDINMFGPCHRFILAKTAMGGLNWLGLKEIKIIKRSD